jgi:hypothetical protein
MILKSGAAVDDEAGDPATYCGAADAFLLSQPARSQASSTSQDEPRAPRQALSGGASAHPALQFAMLCSRQVDP